MSIIPSIDATLPASIDAERAILGSVMHDNACFFEAQEKLEADDFYLDSYRRIFLRMGDLMEAQRAIDIVTLSAELERQHELSTVGGAAELCALTEGLPRRLVISEYIRIVKDKALARRLMAIYSAGIAQAAGGTESAEETMVRVNVELEVAAFAVRDEGLEIGATLVPEAIAFHEEANAPAGATLGANLLTANINRVTAGLMGDELCLLAGRPGSGKTEAGLQIALANARRGLRVYIQSLEMGTRQLHRRLWRLIARVPISAMRDPRCLTPEQRRAIHQAQDEVADLPIFIDDTHELTCMEFRSRAMKAAKRWKADLLIVDYAQLLLAPKAKNSIEEAKKQAETLRHIARDYCRTLALAQLRRAPPNDLNRYPDIEDILGSSAFEQAAQVILMLHRTREEKKYTGEDFCFLGKMRELQQLESFGIRARKWGEFEDRSEEGRTAYWDGRD